MASHRTKGPVCGIENCRSRLYDEGEDGFLYCQNGHRQGGLIRGEDDEDNWATPAARAITRKQKDPNETIDKVAKNFSGRQAFDLFLKSLQLILRHQVWFLVKEKGLPAELEIVIFDLWALRVAQLGEQIASASQESDTQSQVFSTLETDDEDDAIDHKKSLKAPSQRRDQTLKSAPNLYDCLVLCYLGICTLRLPITPGDIYAWVTDGKMAYNGARKLLPLTIRDRLPATYHKALSPPSILSYERFYTALGNLQWSFERDHRVLWPPLNVPLLLYRYLKNLALPLEVYDATIRLGDLLEYDFAFHHPGRQRLGVRSLSEAHLAGCLVVCVKLLYPFDKVTRSFKSFSHATGTLMDWRVWCRAVKDREMNQRKGTSRFTTEQMTKFEEKDVFDLLPEQLDEYLGFYASTFLDDLELQRTKDTNDFQNALYNMFPIEGEEARDSVQQSGEVPDLELFEMVKAVHNAMRPSGSQAHGEEPEVKKPTQRYPVWKNEEDIPERAKIFFEAVGKIAGLSMEQMVIAVFVTEARAKKWVTAQRKKSRQ